MIVLGIDPGTTFSGYTIIDVNEKRVKWIHSGLFRSLLKTVDVNTMSNSRPFIKDIRHLIKTYKPDIIVMESFMVRMTHQSNLMAPISIMIGIVLHMCERRGIEFKTVMANTWKRKLEKDLDKVDNIYDMSYPVKNRLPNHVLDSFFQALYASGDQCYKILNKDKLETIKIKMKDSTMLATDIVFVNERIRELKKLKKPKKRRNRK